MEKVLVEMLKLGMRIEFDTVLKKLKDTEPITIRFRWCVSQEYFKYDKTCDWECFATEEECVSNFKGKSVEMIQTVRKLLDKKNNNL